MKYPISWLKDYVEINIPTQELADKLSLAGLEVEGIDEINKDLSNIVTAQIKEIKQHPDADKLSVTQVFDGKTTHQIVCGAKNIYEGAIVPVSLPGAKLPGGLKIKKAKLRGVESNGMICSESELGCTDTSEGIWLLPEDTPVGEDFASYATLTDEVLDIGILPNRGDCQSIVGLAREISVLLDVPLKSPDTTVKYGKDPVPFKIENKATDACPLYTLHSLTYSNPIPSPLWLQRRLQLCGIRPIHFLVDITNYVLLELGQPLHVFDADTLTGPIQISNAKATENFLTLDENKRKLNKKDLVIREKNGPIALAGIMGGKHSEAQEKSQNILLEAAYFDPIQTRRSAARHALRSESAIRFEKGVDINGVNTAAKRALHLIQTLSGATICKAGIESKAKNHPIFTPHTIPFDSEKINTLLGTTLSEKDMLHTLKKLDITLKKGHLEIPSFRQNDLTEWPCIAEEIARLVGYDNIESRLSLPPQILEATPKITEIKTHIHQHLIATGFSEIITYPMISESDFTHCYIDTQKTSPKLQNPLNPNEAIFRPSLLPGLLKTASFNLKRQQKQLFFFEEGQVFAPLKDKHYPESCHIDGILIGSAIENAYTSEKKELSSTALFDIKGRISTLLSGLKLPITFESLSDPTLHPIEALSILANGKPIGKLGTLHPNLAKAYAISEPVAYFHLNIDAITSLEKSPPKFSPISKFPSTRRDVALVTPKTLAYADILASIQKHQSKRVVDVFLFDHFEGESIGEDKQSLAIAFIYQSNDDTLADDIVNKDHEALKAALCKDLPIQIR